MLNSSGLPNNMWCGVVLSANHVLNRMPHKKLEVTPYKLWKGYASNLNYLKVWGCLANVAFPNSKRESIGPRTFDTIFIGYASSSYRFMHINDKTICEHRDRFMSINDKEICEYRDVEFFEFVYPLKKSTLPHVILNSHVITPTSKSIENEIVEPRRSKRQRTEICYGPDYVTTFMTELRDIDQLDESFICVHMIEEDPKTYDEAMSSIDVNFWKEAINNEIDSIMSNETCEVVDLPKSSRAIGSK